MAALLSALLLRSKKRFAVLVIALLLGATIMSIRIAALQSSAITRYTGSLTSVELQVTTDPNRVVPKVFGTSFAPTSYSFMGQALLVDNKYRMRIPVRVIVSNRSVEGLLPGQKIRVQAKVLVSKERRVAALLIVSKRVQVMTSASSWARGLADIRLGLRGA
ncbi:MAG: hypothetical protein EBS25_06355, partial [Actinobacteria bacterium]|nr:hypothetical protein [Actinomycetota bacterium]